MNRIKGVSRVLALVALVVLSTTQTAHATSMTTQNLVDLVSLSESILVGDVIALSDGIDADGYPYTEVTVRVDETLRGDLGTTHTFRQFGLLEPRERADGSMNLMVSPDGWPRFRADERVMLFLYQPGERYLMQSTVGLLQGKFRIEGETIVNDIGNANLFYNTQLDGRVLTERQTEFVQDPSDMRTSEFVQLVRDVIAERWIETGRLTHAQQ